MRIGFGYDVHPLTQGTALVLGGVSIPGKVKAVGHSDADALIHAICDALLGAAGLPDIGHQFPNTDQRYKGISSLVLLRKVGRLIQRNGWQTGNLDASVTLEVPKVAPHIPAMKKAIARALSIDEGAINIKATTAEKLGFVGKGEGIEAYAVALIKPHEDL